jgi:hypothetical protein
MRATTFVLFGGTGEESNGANGARRAPLRTYGSLAEKLRTQIGIETK